MVKQNLSTRINTDNYFVGVSFSDFQRLQEQDKIKLVAKLDVWENKLPLMNIFNKDYILRVSSHWVYVYQLKEKKQEIDPNFNNSMKAFIALEDLP